jgi:MFS family permease
VSRRAFYLLLLCVLAILTYLDRVCISVAGPRIQDALGIDPAHWGWVGTAFVLSYAFFEVPTGHLGDRIGPRRVLTRVVLWWSAFTALTGAVFSFPILLAVRFLFGAGEAGALPNGTLAISRWFPPESRGRALGAFVMCTQIGGAISPLLVIPIQQRFGWRASFWTFGAAGVLWAAVWFAKFRDHPEGEAPVAPPLGKSRESFAPLLRSRSLWLLMAIAFASVYGMSFYQLWLHTFLVKGRGFSEGELSLSSLPYVCGAAANLLGGFACDVLVRRVGLKWSRRAVGISGAAVAALSFAAVPVTADHAATIVWLSLAYAGIAFQQTAVFTGCLDIGGLRGGAVTGFMNTAAQAGAAVSSTLFGYIVKASGSYDAPLLPIAAVLGLGVLLWLALDVGARIASGPVPANQS